MTTTSYKNEDIKQKKKKKIYICLRAHFKWVVYVEFVSLKDME